MTNNKPQVNGAKKITDNKFLNMYELEAQQRNGTVFPYQVASRAKSVDDLIAVSGKIKADAVAICSTYEDKLVLIKQYRYPVGNYIYELPAGLIDNNETIIEAAKREMFEETGLEFVPNKENEWNIKPWLSSPGMTDETCAVVFGECFGDPTNQNQEESEDIQVILADKEEALRILNNEIVDMRTAMTIIIYINEQNFMEMIQK